MFLVKRQSCTITKASSSGPGCRKYRWSPCFGALKYIRFWVKSECNNKYTPWNRKSNRYKPPRANQSPWHISRNTGWGGACSVKMNFAGLALSAQDFPGRSDPPESTFEPCGWWPHQVQVPEVHVCAPLKCSMLAFGGVRFRGGD